MTRPIDSAVILSQVQTALEIMQSAQRQAALAQLRHESDTDRAKATYQTAVTKKEELSGKTIRDDDPRRDRQRHRHRDEDDDEQQQRPVIDLIV